MAQSSICCRAPATADDGASFIGPGHPEALRAIGPGITTDTRVTLGSLFDLINAIACIGTAVALFPGGQRQNEAAALGFVTARMFEAAVIVIGVVSVLAIVTLFGVNDQRSVWSAITTAPIFLWKLSLGVWLTVRDSRRPRPSCVGHHQPAHRQP